jgi:hypothetical protein
VLLAGCATPPPLVPSPPGTAPPDLRGRWIGSWSGDPTSLLIMEQRDVAADGGLYVGTLVVLGEQLPGFTGILTSTVRGTPVSANAWGWIGYLDGRLTLRVRADTSEGIHLLTLVREGDRLVGEGESSYRWGPQGPVILLRESPPR